MSIWLHAFKETLSESERLELGFDLGSLGNSLAKTLEQICELRERGMSDDWSLKSLKEARNLNDEIQTNFLAARNSGFGDCGMLDKAEPICWELSKSLDRSIEILEPGS